MKSLDLVYTSKNGLGGQVEPLRRLFNGAECGESSEIHKIRLEGKLFRV